MTYSLEQKLACWIDHRLNVMFRRRQRDDFASTVKAAFDLAGLKWSYVPARSVRAEQILADDSAEAFFFDDLDRTTKRVHNVVLDLLRRKNERLPKLKFIWVAVSLTDDEAEFDLKLSDPVQAEYFDIVVDVPFMPTVGLVQQCDQEPLQPHAKSRTLRQRGSSPQR